MSRARLSHYTAAEPSRPYQAFRGAMGIDYHGCRSSTPAKGRREQRKSRPRSNLADEEGGVAEPGGGGGLVGALGCNGVERGCSDRRGMSAPGPARAHMRARGRAWAHACCAAQEQTRPAPMANPATCGAAPVLPCHRGTCRARRPPGSPRAAVGGQRAPPGPRSRSRRRRAASATPSRRPWSWRCWLLLGRGLPREFERNSGRASAEGIAGGGNG
jgi:hypothetical protein